MTIQTKEISRDLLSDSICTRLRESIINRQLKPGEHLIEKDISTRFGTSHAPVREALRQLQKEGLIVTLPFKGSFVYEINADEIEEIYQLRNMIEEFAIDRFIDRIEDNHTNCLQMIVNDMRLAVESENVPDVVDADMKFHMYICQNSSEYPNVIDMWKVIYVKTRLSISQKDAVLFSGSKLASLFEAHQLIVDTLKSRNRIKIREVYALHLQSALNDARRLV